MVEAATATPAESHQSVQAEHEKKSDSTPPAKPDNNSGQGTNTASFEQSTNGAQTSSHNAAKTTAPTSLEQLSSEEAIQQLETGLASLEAALAEADNTEALGKAAMALAPVLKQAESLFEVRGSEKDQARLNDLRQKALYSLQDARNQLTLSYGADTPSLSSTEAGATDATAANYASQIETELSSISQMRAERIRQQGGQSSFWQTLDHSLQETGKQALEGYVNLPLPLAQGYGAAAQLTGDILQAGKELVEMPKNLAVELIKDQGIAKDALATLPFEVAPKITELGLMGYHHAKETAENYKKTAQLDTPLLDDVFEKANLPEPLKDVVTHSPHWVLAQNAQGAVSNMFQIGQQREQARFDDAFFARYNPETNEIAAKALQDRKDTSNWVGTIASTFVDPDILPFPAAGALATRSAITIAQEAGEGAALTTARQAAEATGTQAWNNVVNPRQAVSAADPEALAAVTTHLDDPDVQNALRLDPDTPLDGAANIPGARQWQAMLDNVKEEAQKVWRLVGGGKDVEPAVAVATPYHFLDRPNLHIVPDTFLPIRRSLSGEDVIHPEGLASPLQASALRSTVESQYVRNRSYGMKGDTTPVSYFAEGNTLSMPAPVPEGQIGLVRTDDHGAPIAYQAMESAVRNIEKSGKFPIYSFLGDIGNKGKESFTAISGNLELRQNFLVPSTQTVKSLAGDYKSGNLLFGPVDSNAMQYWDNPFLPELGADLGHVKIPEQINGTPVSGGFVMAQSNHGYWLGNLMNGFRPTDIGRAGGINLAADSINRRGAKDTLSSLADHGALDLSGLKISDKADPTVYSIYHAPRHEEFYPKLSENPSFEEISGLTKRIAHYHETLLDPLETLESSILDKNADLDAINRQIQALNADKSIYGQTDDLRQLSNNYTPDDIHALQNQIDQFRLGLRKEMGAFQHLDHAIAVREQIDYFKQTYRKPLRELEKDLKQDGTAIDVNKANQILKQANEHLGDLGQQHSFQLLPDTPSQADIASLKTQTSEALTLLEKQMDIFRNEVVNNPLTPQQIQALNKKVDDVNTIIKDHNTAAYSWHQQLHQRLKDLPEDYQKILQGGALTIEHGNMALAHSGYNPLKGPPIGQSDATHYWIREPFLFHDKPLQRPSDPTDTNVMWVNGHTIFKVPRVRAVLNDAGQYQIQQINLDVGAFKNDQIAYLLTEHDKFTVVFIPESGAKEIKTVFQTDGTIYQELPDGRILTPTDPEFYQSIQIDLAGYETPSQ
jgi:hypothetical protein